MVFSSTIFLFIFLPCVLVGYYLIDRRFRNVFLLLASLLFYAWGEQRFVFVMMASILMNHLFAMVIDSAMKNAEHLEGRSTQVAYLRKAKRWLRITVVFNLAIFFVYKYLNFTIRNVNALSGLIGKQLLNQTDIALPIGISFFTFQAMSYVFDVYYRRGRVQKNPLNTALYVALFPQLIAGPIVRYETVAQEIKERKETLSDFAEGIRRFILGLAKKVILANSLAILADHAFSYTDFSRLSVVMAWLGGVAYSFQIYFDFSGYSDMAIGLGRMFGFHFLENFEYPYISRSVSEFWRRWHISLGSWFRDYVYFPLGGSRVNSRKKLVRNLFIVWLLTGIWHGAAWNFIAWGLMYFVLLTFEKLSGWPDRLPEGWMRCIYRVFTLLTILLGWVLFRADSLKTALSYIAAMFGLMGNRFCDSSALFQLRGNALVILLAIICSVPILKRLKQTKFFFGEKRLASDAISFVVYICIFLVAVSFTVASTYNPFIYFNF